MELTGLLQIAPFQGMKEEELVALLFGLPNSLNSNRQCNSVEFIVS